MCRQHSPGQTQLEPSRGPPPRGAGMVGTQRQDARLEVGSWAHEQRGNRKKERQKSREASSWGMGMPQRHFAWGDQVNASRAKSNVLVITQSYCTLGQNKQLQVSRSCTICGHANTRSRLAKCHFHVLPAGVFLDWRIYEYISNRPSATLCAGGRWPPNPCCIIWGALGGSCAWSFAVFVAES